MVEMLTVGFNRMIVICGILPIQLCSKTSVWSDGIVFIAVLNAVRCVL